MRILSIAFVLLVGCAINEPDWETGEGAWRLGLKEVPVEQLHESTAAIVNGLSIDEVEAICGENKLGCYDPFNDVIYLYWGAGKITLYHEKAHSIGMTEHNTCYDKGYVTWGNDPETACPDWAAENKADNDYAKRYLRNLRQ